MIGRGDQARVQSEQRGTLIDAVLEAALPRLVDLLERHPDLLMRLGRLWPSPAASTAAEFGRARMSVVDYARHRGVGERTIRYDVKEMTEGVQFERAGRTGRRVVIRVADADAWYAERTGVKATASDIEQLAVDEVTRRRARVALKKRKEK